MPSFQAGTLHYPSFPYIRDSQLHAPSPPQRACDSNSPKMRPTRLSSNLLTVATFLSYLASTKAQQIAKRQDEVNYFINPQAAGPNADFSENLNFNLGSVIDISWVTNYPTVSLQLCQQSNQESASCFPLFANQKAITTAKWTVGLGSSGFDLSYSQSTSWTAQTSPS